jgi:hypothetical protein
MDRGWVIKPGLHWKITSENKGSIHPRIGSRNIDRTPPLLPYSEFLWINAI